MSELIELDKLPNLEDWVPASADLSSEYWTPEDGEVRRMVFWCIETRDAPDQNDANKRVQLECAVFVDPQGDTVSTVYNGSKRLVAAFQNNADSVPQGTPVEVRYLGKKTNRTNAFKSDHWSVVTLKARSK